MRVPIAADFEDARLVAFKLSSEFGFRAGVGACSGELQRLQREERPLEERSQDVVGGIAVEDVGVADGMIDAGGADASGVEGRQWDASNVTFQGNRGKKDPISCYGSY